MDRPTCQLRCRWPDSGTCLLEREGNEESARARGGTMETGWPLRGWEKNKKSLRGGSVRFWAESVIGSCPLSTPGFSIESPLLSLCLSACLQLPAQTRRLDLDLPTSGRRLRLPCQVFIRLARFSVSRIRGRARAFRRSTLACCLVAGNAIGGPLSPITASVHWAACRLPPASWAVTNHAQPSGRLSTLVAAPLLHRQRSQTRQKGQTGLPKTRASPPSLVPGTD